MEEGTPVFKNEPILELRATAQIGLFEMMVTQSVGCAMAVATNASRMRMLHAATVWLGAAGCRGSTSPISLRVQLSLADVQVRPRSCGQRVGIPAVSLFQTRCWQHEDVALAYMHCLHFPDGCHLNLPTEGPLDTIDNSIAFTTRCRPCAWTIQTSNKSCRSSQAQMHAG